MLNFFRSLRGKLILTYTLVTVLALLALEVLVMAVMVSASYLSRGEIGPYLQDVIYVLPPQARNFLQPGKLDQGGLQKWLDEIYAGGKASRDAGGLLDNPAARIAPGSSMVVLSPDGSVLAQAPAGGDGLVGRPYVPPNNNQFKAILSSAHTGSLDALQLSFHNGEGNYTIAVPVMSELGGDSLAGIILVTVQPPPPLFWRLWPVLVGVVLFTGFILLLAVAPFGALFGLIMSRGLTRRLQALANAADAWSEGDFSLQPGDNSGDEIGALGRRMRRMAEHIQTLLQTQHELVLLEERNRLARELHDTVKQQTFATLMQVRAARNLLEKDPDQAGAHLEEAEGLIKSSQQELGLLIAELRPAALEGQGLAGALRLYLDTWTQHSRIPANFQVQNERRLPLAVEQTLYRVAQEALSNVARHSRASAVTISLEYSPARVRLEISDNGAGFDPQTVGRRGIGLQSMGERLAALDGKLYVVSAPGDGARLLAEAPAPGEPGAE